MPLEHLNVNYDVTTDCISRIPIHYHRTLSLTSRKMRSFISDRDFFYFRRKRGLTQPIVYCALGKKTHWYSLGIKPAKKKNASATMFFLMKLPMVVSYFPASSKSVASVGSKIFMMGSLGFEQETEQYTRLMVLDCTSHTWSVTKPMKHGRKIKNLFCCAIKEKIYVFGGCEEDGDTTGSLNVKLEVYSPNSDSWESFHDLVIAKNTNFVLVGSSDDENLSVWSYSHGVAMKYLHDQTGMWVKKASGLLPSKFRNYTHTLLIGTIIIRVMGNLLLWYDEEGSMEWIPVDGFRKLKGKPFNVVDNNGSLVAFGKKVRSKETILWATELHLKKMDKRVISRQIWSDVVFKSDTNPVDFCSTSIRH